MKLILFLLFSFVFCFSQGQSFRGRVLDAETGVAIPYATVLLPDTDNGVIADEDGSFEILKYPRKLLRIQLSSVGYEPELDEVDLTLVSSKDFLLSPSHFELKELIVAFPSGKLSDESIVEVDRKSINAFDGGQSLNLVTTLANMSGLDQLSTGSGIGKPVIRGLTGNRIVVYTQGIRLENQQFGEEHGLGENGVGIERAEVIKGPASLLYGADALGGVLYLVDERYAAIDETESFLSSQFLSNTRTLNSAGGFKLNKRGIKLNLFGAYNTSSDYEIPSGNTVTNTRFNELSLKSSLGFSKDKWLGNLRFGHLKNNFGIPLGDLGTENGREPMHPSQEITQNNISLENVYFLNNGELSLILGYGGNHRQEFEEDQPDAVLDMQLNNWTYNLKWTTPLGSKKTMLTTGVQGMNRDNSNAGPEILIPDSKTNDIGGYSLLNSSLSDRVDIQGGLRFDHRKISTSLFSDSEKTIPELTRTFTSFNFSTGMIYRVGELTIRANVASGFRPPNTAELLSDGQHEGTLRYEVGNPLLENEGALQADLNIQFENEHLSVGVNPFYNSIKNFIFISPTGATIDGNQVFVYDQMDAKMYVAEIGFHFHPHTVHWLHFESNFSSVFAEDKDGQSLPLIPANRILTKLSAEFFLKKKFNGNIFLGHTFKFSQDKVSPIESRSASYAILDIGSTFEFGSFMFEAGVNNLLNTTYIDHLSRLKSDGIPNPGRNIFIGTKLNF